MLLPATTILSFSVSSSVKEYQDVTNFSIASYMQQHQVQVLSRHQIASAHQTEELEYIEARNKMDVWQKQVSLIAFEGKTKVKMNEVAEHLYLHFR